MPILDPGIPVLPGYKPYDEGIERDIFIRDVTGQPYIGEVSLYDKPAALTSVKHVLLAPCKGSLFAVSGFLGREDFVQ